MTLGGEDDGQPVLAKWQKRQWRKAHCELGLHSMPIPRGRRMRNRSKCTLVSATSHGNSSERRENPVMAGCTSSCRMPVVARAEAVVSLRRQHDLSFLTTTTPSRLRVVGDTVQTGSASAFATRLALHH